MSNCYIKIDGYEYDVDWLTSVVLTSILPGKERGNAYIDDEELGMIDGNTLEIVKRRKPEIFEVSDFAKMCASLGEGKPKPSDGPEPYSEEYWEKFRRDYYGNSSTSDKS
jgi:hypothetical protein